MAGDVEPTREQELREAAQQLFDAITPWVEEAPPREKLGGLWYKRFAALVQARQRVREALRQDD